MKVYFPKYYPDFRCLMGDCPHSCCIGWDVEVDNDAYERLCALGGIGEKFKKVCKVNGIERSIKKDECGRCPFLNKDGLCDIMKEGGVGSAPEICRRHPRYFTPVDLYCEGGISIACPMAAKLILTNDYDGARLAPIEYTETLWEEESLLGKECTDELLAIREEIIIDIFSDKYTPADIIAYLVSYADVTIKSFDLGADAIFAEYYGLSTGYKLMPAVKVLDDILEYFAERLEHIDENLPKLIAIAREKLPLGGFEDYLMGFFAPYFKRILAHEIYRYVLPGVSDDYTVGARLMSTVIYSVAAAAVCFGQGAYTLDEIIRLLGAFARDVEYCESNMDALIGSCYSYVALQEPILNDLYERK